MHRLKDRGIRVPKWTVIRPETRLTREQWGDLVVVKPSGPGASFSRGVEIRRAEDVVYRLPGSYPANHPGRTAPMLAQQFINTGPRPAQMRVLTLFGTPLYGEKIVAADEQQISGGLTREAVAELQVAPVLGKRVREFVYDKDVLELARRVYSVMPEVPLQGVDILRQADTGKLFVLEINPGGNTWHFSSKFGQHQRIDGRRRQEQFDAFRVAAQVLVERTRSEAR